ncbi:hypothetical protein NBRC3255_2784 [Gluconobacter thailandicus NBRC 3255]|nr:hypothetical protein NBRC3255_2784 [Gluconobacter thailandicus NBRC 3255]
MAYIPEDAYFAQPPEMVLTLLNPSERQDILMLSPILLMPLRCHCSP